MKTFADIVAIHHEFKCIHPFQDGNGHIWRLVMFRECLANGIIPFIIDDELRMFYYRYLRQWNVAYEYLFDTCQTAKDNFKVVMRYFKILIKRSI